MIQCDDHESSPITDPNPRPLLWSAETKCQRVHCDSLRGGFLHNHPSGDPTPSQADMQMTRAIVDIAAPLRIAVHDHIIVGKNGHASMKGMKLI